MSTSTALTLTNGVISNLQGGITQVITSMAGVIILVLVLFVGIRALKGLWHKKM